MTELNEKSFEEFIASEGPVAVDFWAEWCMPCKMFSPILEEVADTLDGKADFAKLNVDDHEQLAARYGIASIPTLAVFKNGQEQERIIGVRKKEDVIAVIEKYTG